MRATFSRLANELKLILGPAPIPIRDAAADARKKSLFVDVQRRLMIYLRALWDCEFVIKQASIDGVGEEVDRPFIEYSVINLPRVFYDDTEVGGRPVTGLEIYRAAAAHAAAHLRYRKHHLSTRSLDKRQIAMISLIEDARVEALTIRSFPGLQQLWSKQHTATPLDNQNASAYLNRLARALLDEGYQDDDPWVRQGRTLFNSVTELEDDKISRDLGIRLADSFREKNFKFNLNEDYTRAVYRDDNRFLWRRPGQPLEIINPYFRSISTVGIDDGDKTPKNRPLSILAEATDENSVVATYFYPEWNYRSQSEDQSWVTLRESNPACGDLKIVARITAENQHLIARMKALLRAIRDGAAHRNRKLEEGDEIDLNAAIRAQIDIRLGVPPDSRIMMRSVRKTRDISLLMLLDLSRSMNNMIPERQHTALQLTQQVCVLLADAITAVGDPFAIHGFYSDSRHFVEYLRLKDFGQAYDDDPKARIAGMTGRRGTRMGAAVRHATYHLNQQKASKKILLIITDGEPSDVDAPDRKYLHDDTKKSVEDAKRCGIHTYCISLDPAADRYVSRIFGATNYMVVDHVKCLAEKVLLIYAGLTR